MLLRSAAAVLLLGPPGIASVLDRLPEDECMEVLQSLCGNATGSVDDCLGCTTTHQGVFRAVCLRLSPPPTHCLIQN